MIEAGDIQIAVVHGGYVVRTQEWIDNEDPILSGGLRVCVTIEEVLRLVRQYIEAADAYGDGPVGLRLGVWDQ